MSKQNKIITVDKTVIDDDDQKIQAIEAYNDLIQCYRKGNEAAVLLFSPTESAANLRGCLLGRSCGEGATALELITCRLQYDIGYSNMIVKANDEILFEVPTTITVSNKVMVTDLCLIFGHILQGFTIAERMKFGIGRRDINRTLIQSFFNVGRRNKLSMKDVGIDYRKCRQMIAQCLTWSCNRTLVTPLIATMAHRKFVSDTAGKKSPVINLTEATTKFGNRISEIMDSGYVDVTLGFTASDDIQNGGTDVPTVSKHVICANPTKGGVAFNVVVVNNVVSPVFMEKWVNCMNILKFVSGKGGRTNAFIRNASTCEHPSPVVIARKHVYASVAPDTMEMQLIDICIFLANEQRSMIEREYEGLFKVTWHCNLVHTVVAAFSHALYGAHSDFNETCCSDNQQPHFLVSEDHYLPTRNEMQVATMVFSNSNEKFSTDLVYSLINTGDNNSKVELKRIPLSNCCLHWQGPGSQETEILHHVESRLRTQDTAGIFRAHSTFRFTLDPIGNQDVFNNRLMSGIGSLSPVLPATWYCDYNESNVIEKCSHTYLRPGIDEVSGNTQTEEPVVTNPVTQAREEIIVFVNLGNSQRTDRFKQVGFETYKMLAPPRNVAKASLSGTMAMELSRAPAILQLYNAGYLLNIETENKQVISVLHTLNSGPEYKESLHSRAVGNESRLPVPGQHYRLTIISADAGLIHKTRCHPIYCHTGLNKSVMIISQSYKNNEDSIRRYLRRFQQVESDSNLPFFSDNFDGAITIYGSGGAPALRGAYCPTPLNACKDDSMIEFPLSQNIRNPLNLALTQMSYDKKVVTIYVNEALFNSSLTKGSSVDRERPENNEAWCCCLGIFFAHSSSVQEDSEADGGHNNILHGFKSVPYLRVLFKPLFSSNEMKQQMKQTQRKRKRELVVPFGCKDIIDVTESVETIKSMTRREVFDKFMASGRYKKYLVPDQTHPCSLISVSEIGASNCTNRSNDSTNIQTGNQTTESEYRNDDSDDSVCSYDTLNTDEFFPVASNYKADGSISSEETRHDCLIRERQAMRDGNLKCTRKGMCITVPDLIEAMILCSVAGANRYAKKCLRLNCGETIAVPLPPETGLPAVFRVHPMPMPNRALDLISIGLRMDTKIGDNFQRYGSTSWNDLLNATFKSIVLRYTGRLNAYSWYAKDRKRMTWLPDIDDIDDFLSYVRSTINPKLRQAKLRGWVSTQHEHSIPKSTKEFLPFSKFITNVGKHLPVVLKRMIDCERNRALAVHILKEMLFECSERDATGDVGFMSQQVVADVEELFVDPFGKVEADGIHFGSGSKNGLYMIRNGNEHYKKMTDAAVIQSLIKYMEEQVCEADLNMIGYTRAKHGKRTIVNLLNNRALNATDAEHFLCKAWVVAKYTLPNNSSAIQPNSTKPHCHPLNVRGDGCKSTPNLSRLMRNIVRLSTSPICTLKTPGFTLMANEIVLPEGSLM